MPGDHRPASADLQEGRAQPHAHGAAGEAGRDRVVVLAHADARLVVDPMGGQQPGRIERLVGQRQQLRPLRREVLADGAGAMADAAGVIGGVGGLQVLVELTDRGDHGDGDQVPAAEAAALTLHPPFSWAPSRPGWQKNESNP